jgi:hypothetical protein
MRFAAVERWRARLSGKEPPPVYQRTEPEPAPPSIELVLAAWRDFRLVPIDHNGHDLAMDLDQASGGLCRIRVSGCEDLNLANISDEQANALNFLEDQQFAVRDAIIETFDQLWESHLWDMYLCFGLSDSDPPPPEPRSVLYPEFWQDNVGLKSIFIEQASKDDLAYTVFNFDAQWEFEHGTAVLMHGSRVVAMDALDICTDYLIKQDLAGAAPTYWGERKVD